MTSKKSQITAFIIIGIILLFSTALVIYIKNKVAETETSVKFVTEEVPTWAAPVTEFTESCLKDTAKDALLIIGEHGGYIYWDNKLILNELEPTEANSMELISGTNTTIPYWFYLKSKNKNTNYEFSSEAPQLYKINKGDNSVEDQIERYIIENLGLCLNNYRAFKEQNFDITFENITPTVKITQKNVDVYLNLPIEIKKGDSSVKINKYYVSLDVNLNRIYKVAVSIVNAEKNVSFLEGHTLNLVSAFASLDDNTKLPPMAGTDFEKSAKTWLKSNVDKLLTQIFMSYVSVLQIAGTINFGLVDSLDPTEKSVFGLPTIIFADEQSNALDISFAYLGWPIYTKITPNTGELLTPSSFGLDVLFFKMNVYNFVYDISYPVMVELFDKEAFNGEGYQFRFALETNVRNNNYININSTTPLSLLSRAEPSLFCDENQKNSGEITITAKDAATKSALEDVDVYFCIPGTSGCSADSCSMGFTKLLNGTAVLKSKFPIAMGTLKLSKQGYFEKNIPIFTSFNKSMNITAELYPKKTIEIDVKKKMLDKAYDTEADPECNACDYCKQPSSWSFKDTATDIFNGEKVIISLERVKEKEYEEDYNTVGIYSLDEIEGVTNNISLIPGKYVITISSILTFALSPIHNVTIPKFVEGANDDWYDYIGAGDPVCTDIPEIVFNDALSTGGLNAGNLYTWEVTENDLYNSNKLTFYIVSPNITQFIEHNDTSQLDIVDESKTYWSSLKPVFSR